MGIPVPGAPPPGPAALGPISERRPVPRGHDVRVPMLLSCHSANEVPTFQIRSYFSRKFFT
jgi:hypothetical protein